MEYGQIIHPSHFSYGFSGFVLSRLPSRYALEKAPGLGHSQMTGNRQTRNVNRPELPVKDELWAGEVSALPHSQLFTSPFSSSILKSDPPVMAESASNR